MAKPYAYYLPPEPVESEWTSGSQTVPYSLAQQAGGVATFGLGVGALHYIGTRQFGEARGYDVFLRGIRGVEEYFPGRILRTFQLSHLLSPQETLSRQYRYFSPEILAGFAEAKETRQWTNHLSRLIGKDIAIDPSILEKGFRFEGGQLLLGKTGDEVLLKHAGIIRNPILGTPKFQEAYARSLFGGPFKDVGAFSHQIPYITKGGATAWEPFSIVGGHTRLQAAGRYAAGYGTSLVERFNQLARSPFELPIVSDILNKVPGINKLRLDVTPSSGLKTLAGLTLKAGIIAPLAYTGYQQLDWMVRQSSLLDSTIFSEGITAGIATIGVKANQLVSSIAEWTGGHSLREWQEEVAPGSTEISRLLAFPIMGGLGGIGLGYGHRVFTQLSLQATAGVSAQEASSIHQMATQYFKSSLYGTKVSEDLIKAAPIEMVALAQDKAEKWATTRWGKAARWVADHQKSQGVVGRTLDKVVKKATLSRMLGWTGFAAGLAMVAPFIPGALVPSERPEELERIYSGEQEVAVRRGRWWEFGRTPWEGTTIERFRPHWYPRMLSGARDESLYGGDISPITKWYKENLTYDIEREQYWNRPYPITGAFGEDIPFLGPVIAATVGKIFKPPMLMHTEEWAGEGEDEVRPMPLRFGERGAIAELGETGQGTPLLPLDTTGTIGEQAYRLTEMVGLPGFAATSLKEAVTGTPDLFDQEMRLQSAREMYGAERSYWDLELGGMLGTSELTRRLYPHKRRQIPLYNPIRNLMPQWLPGPGEKSPDFLHGDPFAKIPEGELRLPGVGYAALHPELEGVAPEDYPDIWRLKILADIAPYSSQYGETLGRVRAAKNRNELSDEELAMYNTILEQIKEKKQRKEFHEYKYREKSPTDAAAALARINEAYKEKGESAPGIFASLFGSYWENIAHAAETPLDFLTPVSPGAKLVHMRTAIEDYERTNLYGSMSAFWNKPISNFLRPFAASTAHALGWDGIPAHEKTRRSIEEYFDVLKYVKFTRLKNMALEAGDSEAIKEYEAKRRETLFGINPFTRNYTYVYRALPRRERDYFQAFVEADEEQREQIREMVPENEQALYTARWQMENVANWKQAIKKGGLTGAEEEKAEQEIEDMHEGMRTEGFPINANLEREYRATREINETYPDWYRRVKMLPKVLAGRNLPGPDWVGFDPRVRLKDVQLKVIQNLGESPFDYDIWQDDIRAAARMPYLQQAANQLMDNQIDEPEARDRVQQLLSSHGITADQIVALPILGGTKHQIEVSLEEDRTNEIRDIIRKGPLS